jgi:hypothetical protein
MAIRKLELAGMPVYDALKDRAGNDGAVEWFASHYEGKTTFGWTLTERRTTRVGIFKNNASAVSRANARLKTVAAEFSDYVVRTSLCTLESVQSADRLAEQNDGSAYSEYEQSIGGEVVFLDDGIYKAPAPMPEPAPVPAPKVQPVTTPSKPTEPKSKATPYVDKIPGITPDAKYNAVLAPFLEAFHKMYPDVVWTGTLWTTEKTKVMVSADATLEMITKLRRGNAKLKWVASSYKGKTMNKRWFVAEHSLPGVLTQDTAYYYRVALALPSTAVGNTIALRVLAYKKS